MDRDKVPVETLEKWANPAGALLWTEEPKLLCRMARELLALQAIMRAMRTAVNEAHEEDAQIADALMRGPMNREQWLTANQIAETIRARKLP